MGSFGTTEIILILVVGFIILGPKGLSKLVKTIGKALGEFSGIKEDVKNTIYDVKDSVYDVKNSFDDAVTPVRKKKPHQRTNNIKKIEKKIMTNKENK